MVVFNVRIFARSVKSLTWLNTVGFVRQITYNITEVMRMARIEARIDGTIKSKAKDVLANHGLTISDFMRMTLTTVAHDGLPKYYSIPNRQLKN